MHPVAHISASSTPSAYSSSPDIPQALLNRKGLATALGCSLRTVDNLQAAGMPCVFIGRSRRFVFSEVLAWLKRKGSN